MSRRVLKWQLPVDDEWHPVPGYVQHVEADAFDPGIMWLWAEEFDAPAVDEFRVYGTGHEFPDEAAWAGTARHEPTGLVWHVMVRTIESGRNSDGSLH